MNRIKNVIYADNGMNGYQLRNALREQNVSTKFLNHNHQMPVSNRKCVQSEEAIYFQELAESRGYSVDDVVVTENTVLIRTKF